MSHEIRTPLNGIIGVTELLQSTDFDQLAEQMLRYRLHQIMNHQARYASQTSSTLTNLLERPCPLSILVAEDNAVNQKTNSPAKRGRTPPKNSQKVNFVAESSIYPQFLPLHRQVNQQIKQ